MICQQQLVTCSSPCIFSLPKFTRAARQFFNQFPFTKSIHQDTSTWDMRPYITWKHFDCPNNNKLIKVYSVYIIRNYGIKLWLLFPEHPSTHVGGDMILCAHIFFENNQWFGLSKFRTHTNWFSCWLFSEENKWSQNQILYSPHCLIYN